MGIHNHNEPDDCRTIWGVLHSIHPLEDHLRYGQGYQRYTLFPLLAWWLSLRDDWHLRKCPKTILCLLVWNLESVCISKLAGLVIGYRIWYIADFETCLGIVPWLFIWGWWLIWWFCRWWYIWIMMVLLWVIMLRMRIDKKRTAYWRWLRGFWWKLHCGGFIMLRFGETLMFVRQLSVWHRAMFRCRMLRSTRRSIWSRKSAWYLQSV